MWEWKPIDPDKGKKSLIQNTTDYIYKKTLGDDGLDLKAAWRAYEEKKKGFDLIRYGMMTNKGTHDSMFTRHAHSLNQCNFNGGSYVSYTGLDFYDSAPMTVFELYKSVNCSLNYFICHDLGTDGTTLYWPLLDKKPLDVIKFDYSLLSVKTPFCGTVDFFIPHFAYVNLHSMNEHPGLFEYPFSGSIFDYPTSGSIESKYWYRDFELFLQSRFHLRIKENDPSSRDAHNLYIMAFRPHSLQEYQTLIRTLTGDFTLTRKRESIWTLMGPFDHS